VVYIGDEDAAGVGRVVDPFNPIVPLALDEIVPVEIEGDIAIAVATDPMIGRYPVNEGPACVEDTLVIDELWPDCTVVQDREGV
jgi:hypothetical protein